jgi:hypothetical protein
MEFIYFIFFCCKIGPKPNEKTKSYSNYEVILTFLGMRAPDKLLKSKLQNSLGGNSIIEQSKELIERL